MNKSKKVAIIVGVVLAIVILLLSLSIVFFSGKDNGNNDNKNNYSDNVKIKDNVNIITSETDIDFQPKNVTEDSISFTSNPKYKTGDIIVAGIIDSAPNGFIRRVTNVTKSNGVYEYKTEYAVLTDVFEEAHIIKTFVITDEEVKNMDDIDNGVMTLNLSTATNDPVIQSLAYNNNSNLNINKTSAVKIKPSENGLGVMIELDDKMGESLQVNGQVEVATYFEIKIDIENGEINFGMAVHTDTSGELFVGLKEELFDKNDKDNFSGEYEKEIISKSLPNIQFSIGPVPVVITNDFELSAEVSAQLEGQIGTTVGVNAERVSGFEYSSKTGKIVEINEKNYLSDGIEWKTEAKASGELEAGIYAHLVTKLYGSTGTDLSVGIAGDVEGELALGIDEKSEPTMYGKLALSVAPKASGKIVVTVPVVDYDLVEAEIFKVTLPAFWEKEWEVANPTPQSTAENDQKPNNSTPHSTQNTYITKFEEINGVEYPAFLFDYSNNWTITNEEVTPTSELVTLENDNGSRIDFLHISDRNIGGGSNTNMSKVKVSKIADSQFVPSYVQGTDHSDLGKFMVAELKTIGILDMRTDTDYRKVDGNVSYAVLPKAEEGIRENVNKATSGEFVFWYSGNVSFTGQLSDNYTEQEKEEMIEILSSFRVE